MKTLSRNIPAWIAGLGMLFIAVASCNKEDVQTVLSDVRVTAGTEVYFNALNIQLFDAGDSDYPTDPKITLSGRDKDKLLTLAGDRLFKVEQGVLEFGVPRDLVISPANPLEFCLQLEAPGYLPMNKCYRLTDGKFPTQEVLKMVKLSTPPQGVHVSSHLVGLNQRGQVANTTIIRSITNSIELTIPQGAAFIGDRNNTIAGDNLLVYLVHFDPSKEGVAELLPGNAPYVHATDNQGNNLGNGILTPFGFYSVEMYIGRQKVVRALSPINVSIAVSREMKRSVASPGAACVSIRQNDAIPVWSFNAQSKWSFEFMTQLAAGRTGLRATYQQYNLNRYWAVADPANTELYEWLAGGRAGSVPNSVLQPTCNNQIQIVSNYPAYEEGQEGYYNRTYCVKFKDACNPHITLGTVYSDLSNGRILDLSRFNAGQGSKVILDILMSEDGDNLHRTGVLDVCTGSPSSRNVAASAAVPLDLSRLIPLPTGSFCFYMDINLSYLDENNVTRGLRPSGSLYFSKILPNGKKRFQYLGSMINGKMLTCRLFKETPYAFKATRGFLNATTDRLGQSALIFPATGSCTVPANIPNCAGGSVPMDLTAANDPSNASIVRMSMDGTQVPRSLVECYLRGKK